MTSLSYRYLRRRFSGVIPSSGLGRFALYVAVLDLLFVVVQRVLYLFDATASAGAALAGWISFLGIVLSLVGGLLLVRWMRRRLLWRLRNRLLVTYVFIGVIPVVLIVSMALMAAYLFAGQFATFLAVSEMNHQMEAMAGANQLLATEVAQASTSPAALEKRAQDRIGATQFLPGTETAIWVGGKYVAGGHGAAALPAWLQESLQAVVVEDDHLYLRAVNVRDTPAGRVTVVSSLPFEPAMSDRLAKALGELRVFTPDFENTDQAWEVEPDGQPGQQRSPIQLRVGGTQSGVSARDQTRRRSATISAGLLAPPTRTGDNIIIFGTPHEMVDWKTGKRAQGLLGGRTRFSILYPTLFSKVGRGAGIVLFLLTACGVVFGIIELVALFIGLGLTRTITRSVANLYEATERINRGDFSYRIQVRSRDQLAALETSFNAMTTSLEKLLAEQKEKERLQSELAIAQEVQGQLFPKSNLHLDSLELYGVCRPARTVSGDYYDFLPLGGEKMGIAVGDISGKGISAALVMATLHSAVRVYEFGGLPHRAQVSAAGLAVLAALRRGEGRLAPDASSNGIHSPSEMLWLLNRHLFHNTPEEKYATLFLGVFDGPSRRITYSNAGHLPPVVVGEDGSHRRLAAGGMPIGLFDNLAFEEGSTELNPGDIFVAYSDGVTEPENEFGEFGEPRLLELVREHRHGSLERVAEVVLAAVADWIGSAEQPDDVTLVLARLR